MDSGVQGGIGTGQEWFYALFYDKGVQMKYVSKLTDARRTSREEGSSLFDCAVPCRGNMPLKRRMGRAASSGEGHSLT